MMFFQGHKYFFPLISIRIKLLQNILSITILVKLMIKRNIVRLCTHCRSEFSRQEEDILNHCKLCERAHPPERQDKSYKYVCFTCDYHTYIRTDMARHIRCHTGDKPYKCNFCPYSSKTNKNLVHHLKTHTGEKPFQCELCSYVCARKSHLKLHLKRKHSNKSKDSV
uniref:Protein hunchback n=1 Tax=Cacopsylla melanoneura TaxID=428564 RepID=A0A8D9DYD0_9HEMI